jgi:hypothetical protein
MIGTESPFHRRINTVNRLVERTLSVRLAALLVTEATNGQALKVGLYKDGGTYCDGSPKALRTGWLGHRVR